jgi:hypothetical protein
MATVTFLEPGSDHTQDLSSWPAANLTQAGASTLASASDQAHTGLRSIKAVTTAGGNATTASPDGILANAGSRVSLWARFSTVSPGTRTIICEAATAGYGSTVFAIGIDSTGVLVASGLGVGITAVLGTTALAASIWYRLSWAMVLTSPTSWTLKVYLNGALEITTTNAQGTLNGGGAITASTLGVGSDSSSNANFPSTGTITMWIDDIYVDNGTDLADPGNISVTAKRAFANGTTNGFSTNGSSSGYGSGHSVYVNGNYPLSSDTTTYLSAVATATTEEFNIEGLTVGDVNLTGATLRGVQGWISATSTLTETDHIVVDGTLTAISVTNVAAPGTIFTQNSATPTVYPAGTGSDIGLTTTALATTKLFMAGILVAYIPAVVVADGQEWLGRMASMSGPRIMNVAY